MLPVSPSAQESSDDSDFLWPLAFWLFAALAVRASGFDTPREPALDTQRCVVGGSTRFLEAALVSLTGTLVNTMKQTASSQSVLGSRC